MAQFLCNFFSYSLWRNIDITVTLPTYSPCVEGAPKTHAVAHKYPVLFLLHGHGNDLRSWSRYTCMERYAEERSIAVVTCSVSNKAYMNAPEYGEYYYDFVEQELPEFVRANFPISERVQDCYLGGLSMGGYGTLAHGLGHPSSYRAIGAFSPATCIGEDSEERMGHRFPPVMNLRNQLEENLKSGVKLPDLFLCIGQQDFLYEDVTSFHQFLEQKGVAHRYDDVPGYEHEWAFWELELPKFLDWLPRTDPYAALPHRKV